MDIFSPIPRQPASGPVLEKKFLTIVATKLKDARNIERLSENVWLVNFLISPSALAWLIALADQRGVEYKILQLDDAPQWLPADPNSVSNQV